MADEYKYKSITVRTRTGGIYENEYCDYFVQDNILTVFRDKAFSKIIPGRGEKHYYKFETHYPMEAVERINCIEK